MKTGRFKIFVRRRRDKVICRGCFALKKSWCNFNWLRLKRMWMVLKKVEEVVLKWFMGSLESLSLKRLGSLIIASMHFQMGSIYISRPFSHSLTDSLDLSPLLPQPPPTLSSLTHPLNPLIPQLSYLDRYLVLLPYLAKFYASIDLT